MVSRNEEAIGVIHLKDVVKGGIKWRFVQFPKMSIKTVMITGGNPLTVAAITAEAGVDGFLSAVIFNALIIIALIPLALKGVLNKPKSNDQLLRNNLFSYGPGGWIAPFIGIKPIDMLLVGLNLI